jgi:hypothetical protein
MLADPESFGDGAPDVVVGDEDEDVHEARAMESAAVVTPTNTTFRSFVGQI